MAFKITGKIQIVVQRSKITFVASVVPDSNTKNEKGFCETMQVRFLGSGTLKKSDGSDLSVGAGEIYPCESIVYHDESRRHGDIHLLDGTVINDVEGDCFEPMGYDVQFKPKDEPDVNNEVAGAST